MKSKIFCILGVVATVAILASTLAAPAFALSGVNVSLAAQGSGVAYTISNPNIYTVSFTAGAPVAAGGEVYVAFPATTSLNNLTMTSVVAAGGAYNLPAVGAAFKITAAAATDTASLTVTTGTVSVVMSGAGTYAAGVITFAAIGETATVTATADSTGTWAPTTGSPVAAGTVWKSDDVIMTALQGIGNTPIAAASCYFTVSGTYPAAQTLIITVPAGGIGTGSLVGLTIGTLNGVQNASTAGNYTLSVSTYTSAAVAIEAAVTSGTFALINPTIAALPGIVKIYNAASIQLTQTTSIATALGYVSGPNFTITLGEGTYSEGTLTIPAAAYGLTVKATGALANTIVMGNWAINTYNVTFTGLTLEPSITVAAGAGPAVTIGTSTYGGVKIDSCAFTKSFTATTTVAQTFITYANSTANTTGMISNNTFDTSLGDVSDVAINVATGSVGLTVSNNTFTLDINDVTYSPVYGDAGVYVNASCTIDSNTFKASGWGGAAVVASTGTATVTNNKFGGGILSAIYVLGGSVNFNNNAVTGVGLSEALWPWETYCPQPVDIEWGLGTVSITQNTFKSNPNDTIFLRAGAFTTVSGITVMYNDIETSNKLGINNQQAGVLNATHNYWGAATGPVKDYNYISTVATSSALAANVNDTMYLGNTPTNSTIAVGVASLDKSAAAVGVAVSVVNATTGAPSATVNYIGLSTYAKDPVAAFAANVTPKQYWDVVVNDATTTADAITIRFYATGLDANSQMWVWNTLSKSWILCSNQTLAINGGYIAVTVNAASTPALVDMSGTPFALVDGAPDAPVLTLGSAAVPAMGAVDVPIDFTFSWAPVANAVSYEVAVAQDSSDYADKFTVINYAATTTVAAHKIPAAEQLLYNTQYWWRVRSVDAAGNKSAWAVSFFTTEKEPSTAVTTAAVTPTVIVQNPTQTTPTIVVTVPAGNTVQPIPGYLLWAVIAVGAILVIAVIVLIVRTRRIS